MSDLLFWLADHVALWRPFAITLLSLFVLGCFYWAFAWWSER